MARVSPSSSAVAVGGTTSQARYRVGNSGQKMTGLVESRAAGPDRNGRGWTLYLHVQRRSSFPYLAAGPVQGPRINQAGSATGVRSGYGNWCQRCAGSNFVSSAIFACSFFSHAKHLWQHRRCESTRP